MNFINLIDFTTDWLRSLRHYYGAYIVALCTSTIRAFYIYYDPASSALSEILLSCGILFPLMVTSSLISQITGKQKIWNIVGHVISFILGIGFYSYIRYLGVFNDDYSGMEQHHIFVVLSYVIARGSLLGGIAHSTYKTPLLTRGWLKELVINVTIAILSSLILRGGLSASMGSIDYLFNIDIYYKRYQYIGVIAFCLVGVSILLTNFITIQKVDDYPKIFRFFGLYIFLPLAAIYAVILITYGTKILITQTRPKGLISWMVMGYTIRCTIVYFLTYPLENKSGIKKIHTGYFVSILVFLPLLVGAIRQRIAQYGITEARYLLIMISLWIAIIGIGSLIWKSKSWLLMIGGLLVLAISSTYTPWSASSISHSSQYNRFEDSGFTGTFDKRQEDNRQSYYSDSDDVSFSVYMNKGSATQLLPIQGYSKIAFISSQDQSSTLPIQLSDYGEQLYQFSLDQQQTPIIITEDALIVIENLNGVKHKKTNTYSIDYYSLMVFTK